MSSFVPNFLQNKHIVLKVYALWRSYLDFIEDTGNCFHFYAQTVLCRL